MKLRTIKTRVIEMTREEAEKFLALVQTAVQGHTVHSASTGLSDGTHLAVTVLTPEQERAAADEEAARQEQIQRNHESRMYAKRQAHERRVHDNDWS